MKIFYDLGILCYWAAIRLFSLFDAKAKLWVEGRKNIFQTIENSVEKGAIWIHAASLGEFEQGRPLIEAIKNQHPNQKILLTFFSPSGYELRKNYPLADFVYYLPLDTLHNAQRFFAITQPQMVIFIKYEFWHYYIYVAQQRNIPIFSISALFRPNQIFFKWYGKWFKNILHRFTHIFVQNQDSLDILMRHKIEKSSIAGDTRVDRVLDIKGNSKIFPIVKAFSHHANVLVAGSTWQPDEAILQKYCEIHHPIPFKIIIAPHNIHEPHIAKLAKRFPKEMDVVRYSKAKNFNVSAAEILIIDNIGMLSSIYGVGKWAYIGGAFGKGLHNTLEPIVFGLPVIFGQKYEKFEEAKWLVQHRGGFSIQNYNDFENTIKKLQINENYKKASQSAFNYIETNKGATAIILKKLEPYLKSQSKK